jgi:hypothetical protein
MPAMATTFTHPCALRIARVSCMPIHKSTNAVQVYRW